MNQKIEIMDIIAITINVVPIWSGVILAVPLLVINICSTSDAMPTPTTVKTCCITLDRPLALEDWWSEISRYASAFREVNKQDRTNPPNTNPETII
ncbi:hypothetical protein RvVAR0630_pl05230 (plasmid) [Agrobacterium vitis]|nr:hypothetical protein RvVAR0630_pl05230 [Agrobacterium vitis]